MVSLPLAGRSGHHALFARRVAQISSASGFFNRGIFEWTVHEDETVKPAVPEKMGADCSLRRHNLFPIRSLIERQWRSHFEGNGGAAGNCVPLAR
jgi:hypothetical protein